MSISDRRFLQILLIAALLCLPTKGGRAAVSNANGDAQVCSPLADYFLGMEDYQEAIRLHQRVIREHPENALAHYHLGFAYGLMGRHQDELHQYQRAVDLGLSDWELFLNLGLLYIESQQLNAATDVLRLATLLGPNRSETHFNLALAYERRAMFEQAEQEMLLALRLDPSQADAQNTLAVIYAEEGNYSRAREEWSDLIHTDPDYEPARKNLAILDQVERGGVKSARGNAVFGHQ